MNNRIVIVTPERFPVPALRGGAFSIWAEQLLPHLTGYEILVLSAADESLPAVTTAGNVTFRRIDESIWLRRVANMVSKVPLIGRRFGPRLHGYAYLKALLPFLSEADIVYVLNRPQFLRGIRSRLPHARLILRLGNLHLKRPKDLLRADWIDCCSEFVASNVRQAIGRLERVGVTMEGVDCQLFRPAYAGEGEALRRAFGVSEGLMVLFVGRIVVEKGVQLLVEAAKVLEKRGLSMHFLVVGEAIDARFEASLRQIAPGSVHFLGHRSQTQVASLMRSVDLFVGPSLWEEPAGRVFGEAMASGTPVLATRSGGIPETLEASGGGVLLPTSMSADVLADALEAMAFNPDSRSAMAKSGLEWSRRHLSWPAIAQSVDSLLREVSGLSRAN